MGSPTGDTDWAFYDILDCVHIKWACNKLFVQVENYGEFSFIL